jgi:hypothetical protein
VQRRHHVRFEGTVVDDLFRSLTGRPSSKVRLPPAPLPLGAITPSDMFYLLPVLAKYLLHRDDGLTVQGFIDGAPLSCSFVHLLRLYSRVVEGPCKSTCMSTLFDLGLGFGLRPTFSMAAPTAWTDVAQGVKALGVDIYLNESVLRLVEGAETTVETPRLTVRASKVYLCVPPKSLYNLLRASGISFRGVTKEWSRRASFRWKNATVLFNGRVCTPEGYWWSGARCEAVAADAGRRYGEKRSRVCISGINADKRGCDGRRCGGGGGGDSAPLRPRDAGNKGGAQQRVIRRDFRGRLQEPTGAV